MLFGLQRPVLFYGRSMAAMTTRDGRWRVEVGGTGAAVVWYRLLGPDVDRWLPSTPALVAEIGRHGVDLADLHDAADTVAADTGTTTDWPA